MRTSLQTWPAFIVLARLGHFAHRGDSLVFWGAVDWLVSRVLYLPLYLSGVAGRNRNRSPPLSTGSRRSR